MKRSRKQRGKLVERILLPLFGIFLGLSAAELSLRLAETVYRRSRGSAEPRAASSAEKVLCVGDSYTYGIGAPPGFSYPDQLQRILDNRYGRDRYRAINEGVPGLNSSRLADRVEGLLERHRPRLLLLLTGINNITLEGSHYALFDPKSSTFFSRAVLGLRLRLQELRLYKLIAQARRAPAEEIAPDFHPAPCSKDARRLLSWADGAYSGTQFEAAEKLMREAVLKDAACADAHFGLGLVLYKREKYEEAFRQARRTIELAPGHPQARWLLSKELPLMNPEETAPVLDQVLRYDLGLIVIAARRYGALPVLQTYPWGDRRLKRIQKEVAERYKIPVIDHAGEFQKIPEEQTGRYSSHDEPGGGHPNALGYKMMAEDIFESLRKTGVLP